MVRGNWTRDEFASLLDVHKNTVARWERGDQFPDVQQIGKILELVPDINPNWLVTGEEPMKRVDEQLQWGTAARDHGPQGFSHVATTNYDKELTEIIRLLQYKLPEARPFVLKLLHGRLEMKEALAGLGMNSESNGEGKK